MWGCFGNKGPPNTVIDSDDEETAIADTALREDSVYRYYHSQYLETRRDLRRRLERLEQMTPGDYAEGCSLEVMNGTRSQAIIAQIRALKKELRLCQFRTLRLGSAMDTSSPLSPQQPTPEPLDGGDSETPLPDWITREIQKPKSLTPDQQHRAAIQAASNVLTMAGQHLPTDRPLGYFQIFNLYDSAALEREDVRTNEISTRPQNNE